MSRRGWRKVSYAAPGGKRRRLGPAEQDLSVFASPDLDAKFHGATPAAGWRHEALAGR
jgi:hypothetical protein